MASSSQFEVAQPPNDAVSAVVFASESPRRLLVSSWDKKLYMYEIAESGQEAKLCQMFEQRAPVMDVCFGANDHEAFTAGMDHQVKRIDLVTGEQTVMTTHSAPVRCVVFSNPHSLLVSASWDSTLQIRNMANPSQAPVSIRLPGKPHALAASPSKLVVAMTARLVHIYDLDSLASALSRTAGPLQPEDLEPWQKRESSLKFLTRAVACMPSDAGYATSSIEGRVAVEWFDSSASSQARKYAFKCHRQQADGDEGDKVDNVYPVNALAFHPRFGTFASGGGDGTVALWDAEAKRRMRQYQKFPESVAALAFSPDGRFLAIGVCPGFETGMEDYSGAGRTKVFIRELSGTEAKGKGSK